MDNSRRNFLAIAGLTSLGAFAAGTARAAGPAAATCYAPSGLTMAEKSSRSGLGFVEMSPDPKKHCGLCAFFMPSQGTCGTCQLMSGGRVQANGVCMSFAPKQA